MTRFAHILIASTYAMTALVIAAACIRFAGAPVAASFGAAVIATLGAAQIQALFAAAAERTAMRSAMARLRDANLLLVEEIEDARARLEEMDVRIEEAREVDDGREALMSEVRTLEGLVRTLNTKVEREADQDAFAPAIAAPQTLEHVDRNALLGAVKEALEAGRVDLHLQPVVSLPQRKTRFYEGFTRLRDANGRIIMPAEWLKVAEPEGLVGAIDNLLLFRCIQIVRRLAERERRVGVFCNVAPASLADEEFFPEFLDFVRRNGELAGSLIFEMSQRAFLRRNHVMARNISRLADFGFRFSIDGVTDLDIDLAELQRAGVKFLKVPGSMLTAALQAGKPLGLSAAPDVRAEDFGALCARYGIDVIAEKIEAEATVVEVLDLDIRYGQGHLFGSPRPIRDDVREATDKVAREHAGSGRLAS